MEGRKQHMARLSDQPAQRVELGAKGGMQTFMGITENSLTATGQEADRLLENILPPPRIWIRHINRWEETGVVEAWIKRLSQKSQNSLFTPSTSICRRSENGKRWLLMQPHLRQHRDELTESIYAGKYQPNPVRRVVPPSWLYIWKTHSFTGEPLFTLNFSSKKQYADLTDNILPNHRTFKITMNNFILIFQPGNCLRCFFLKCSMRASRIAYCCTN
jgi:hypothetical protein